MRIYCITLSLVISIVSLRAQSGPGGVRNATSNKLWIDAAQHNSSSLKVSTIPDFSGNGNNLTQATFLRRPEFNTNVTNSHPAYNFDGTKFIESAPIAALNNTNLAWFAVFRSTSNASSQYVLTSDYTSGAGASSSNTWGTTYSKGQNSFNSFARKSSGTAVSCFSSYNNNFNISNGNWNLTSNELSSYFNGNLECTNVGLTATPTGHKKISVGSKDYLSAMFNGFISEIIIFNSLVNETERRIIENYLGNKYNIAFSGDMYAFQNTHQFEIAGIGQTNATDKHLDSRGSATVRIFNPSSINDGEFMFWGHDNGVLTVSSSETPPTIVSRYPREWRVSKTGDAGTVTIEFNVTSFTLPDASKYVLMTDADGDFTNATLSAEVSAIGGFVTFTNVTLNDGDFFTLANRGDIESIADGSWQTPATWNCNCVPSTASNVTIKTTHDVTIEGNSFSGNLTIENGASLTLSTSNILSITGNFANSGTFTATTGTTEFAGSATQTIGGTSITTFSSININNGNTLQLLTDAALTNQLLFTNGNFSAGTANMTLISNASGTAQIGVVPGASTISGNFIIQRFVPGGNAYWDFLSSPVQSTTLNDWDDELIMSVPGGTDGISYGSGEYEISVRTYNEAISKSEGIPSVSSSLLSGAGYQAFLGDNRITFASRTFDTRGVPSFGNISKPLDFTSAARGYNLIGNPYASDIDWSVLFAASTNIQNQYYIYDKTTKGFKTFNGGGTIPSSQGFMVRATASGAQVNFTEASKVSGSATWTRTANPNFSLNLKITEKNNIYGGFVVIKSDINAANELDELDGGYIENDFDEDSPNIYTQIDDEKLQINTISEDDFSKQIDVFVKANRNGSLIISSDIINNSTNYSNIYLEDVDNNKIVDLKNNNTYEFKITDKETRKKFVLHLNKNNTANPLSAKNQSTENNIIFINSSENCGLIISSEKPAQASILVTNMLGQEVVKTETSEILEPTKVLLNLPNNSVYLVKVTIGNSVYTNKVIR